MTTNYGSVEHIKIKIDTRSSEQTTYFSLNFMLISQRYPLEAVAF